MGMVNSSVVARTSLIHQQKQQDQHLNFSLHIRTDTMFKLVLSHPLGALFKTHCRMNYWPTVVCSGYLF